MVGSDETPRRPPRLQGRLTPAIRPASAAGQEHPPDAATQPDHPRHRTQLRRAALSFAAVSDIIIAAILVGIMTFQSALRFAAVSDAIVMGIVTTMASMVSIRFKVRGGFRLGKFTKCGLCGMFQCALRRLIHRV